MTEKHMQPTLHSRYAGGHGNFSYKSLIVLSYRQTDNAQHHDLFIFTNPNGSTVPGRPNPKPRTA